MKVVLIRPPKIQGALERSMVQHPISLLYLAAVLQEYGQGFEPEVWDFEVEDFSEQIIRDRVRKSKPGVVGITSMTCNIIISSRIAGWLKDEDPEITTVIGGPHSSAIPERTLEEFKAFDVVAVGEGERTFLELCQRKAEGQDLGGMPGTVLSKGAEIVRGPQRPLIENLDWLPNPARGLIDLSNYKGASTPGLDATLHRSTELFSSRGCPEKCIFCASHLVFGRKVRFRSSEHIFREVDECSQKWGYRHFTIDDDTFTYNPRRLEQICRGFHERNITWDCDTRVNAVNEDMLRKMAASGCQKVAFGVESGSQRILDLANKGITIAQIKDAFKWAHQAGLITTAFFMIGSHPSETREELEMSFKLMCEIDTELMALAIAVPYPGTELYRLMREKGLLFEERWEKFTHLHSIPSWRTENFTGEQMAKLQTRLFRRFFIRPRFIRQTLRKALSWHGMKYYTRSLIQIMRYLFIEGRS
jgi:anaerobic magnesium-protoporphyrin IX monomethyl ester cyclase